MQTNVGNRDALTRAALAVGFFAGSLLIQTKIVLSFVLLLLALWLGLTALFGMCPLYALLHIDTSHEPGMPRSH